MVKTGAAAEAAAAGVPAAAPASVLFKLYTKRVANYFHENRRLLHVFLRLGF